MVHLATACVKVRYDTSAMVCLLSSAGFTERCYRLEALYMPEDAFLVVLGVVPHLQSWGSAGVPCQMQELGHHCQKLAQAGPGHLAAALLNPACHLAQYPTQTYSQSVTFQTTR